MFDYDELLELEKIVENQKLKRKITKVIADADAARGKCVWDFYWDCGRDGALEGRFIATKEEVAKKIGEKCYFGSVLGKHSEIFGVLEESDITLVTEDPVIVCKSATWGFNPLERCKL